MSDEDEVKIIKLIEEIRKIFENKPCKVNEIEFEKDDDKNGHIDFMSFYSNFRAQNYSIT